MIKLVASPDFFNGLLFILMLINGIRFAIEANYPQMFYWLFAAGITATVAIGMKG